MLTPLADRWIAVRNTTNPSPNTVAARRHDLTVIADHLADFLERDRPATDDGTPMRALDVVSVEDLNRSSLEAAFAHYAADHAPSSTRRVMSTWRQFCLWLIRESQLAANPLDLIDGPRRDTWAPKPLHAGDLEAVAHAVQSEDPTSRHPWPTRDEALFALFITGGLRASEAINARLGDLDLDSDPARLRVVGKGDKPRTVTLPPETAAVFRHYLAERTETHGTPEPGDPLIVRTDGRPCTRSALDHLVRGWFRRAGRTPPPGALAHSLRHTYATLLIDNGASLPEVRRLLGHADLSTTQAYIGVTGKALEEAALSNPARHLLRPGSFTVPMSSEYVDPALGPIHGKLMEGGESPDGA